MDRMDLPKNLQDTLAETKPASGNTPENGWLEDDPASFWEGQFSGANC